MFKNKPYRLISTLISLLLIASCSGRNLSVTSTAAYNSPYSNSGLLIRSQNNENFPSESGLSNDDIRDEINTITDYASSYGYGNIFLEVRSEGESLYSSSAFPKSQFWLDKQGAFSFFDPLAEMIKSASEKGISVYAVIDPYFVGEDISALSKKHPAVKHSDITVLLDDGYYLDSESSETISLNIKDIESLAKKYNLAGIALQNITPGGSLTEGTLRLFKDAQTALSGKISLGAFLGEDIPATDSESLIGLCDMIIPTLSQRPDPTEDGFENAVLPWQNAANDKLSVLLNVNESSLSSVQLSAQAFVLNQNGIPFIAAYSPLLSRKDHIVDFLSAVTVDTGYTPIPLGYEPSNDLTVTRPEGEVTLSSDYSSYCIFGTSNADEPLYLDGEFVERASSDGLFAVLVGLEYGRNEFVLTQGETSVKAAITRAYPPAASTTERISSAAPVNSLLAYPDAPFTVTCTAPSGAEVTATLSGVTVGMRQRVAASGAVPATFEGSFTFSDISPNEVRSLGTVTYNIIGGQSGVSGGSVYLVGKNALPALRVTNLISSVYPDQTMNEGEAVAIYKRGTTEQITGQLGEYYSLASGRYTRKANVEVITLENEINTIESASLESSDKTERIILSGDGMNGVPYTFTLNEDNTHTLTLHATTLAPSLNTSSLPESSDVFSAIDWVSDGDSIVCTLTPKPGEKIWALDLLYENNNAVIYIKKRPQLSQTAGKPFENLTVVLDAGHGGNDIGAPSVIGASQNINEREVNLANALMLKMRLEQLGATVYTTRDDNQTTLTLYDRMQVAQEILPDFFISLHHNSISEMANANNHYGVEAYFYEPFGEAVAAAAVKNISEENYERKYRTYEYGWYVVTKMRYTPSILCEIGFVPSPAEFSKVVNLTEIHKTSGALINAMLETISAQ